MIYITILSLLAAFGLLTTLTIIDLRHYLLPNIYVFPFGVLGIVVHWSLGFDLLSLSQMAMGAVAGYGILYLIRMGGNYYYKQDSLGLGDVKLLGMAGLWLGLQGVMMAMTAGAVAGLLHGIIVAGYLSMKNKQKFSISRLMIPAGPGFIIGIIGVFIWQYHRALLSLFYDYFL